MLDAQILARSQGRQASVVEAVHTVVRKVERRVLRVTERVRLRPVQILFYRRAM